jgi:RIO kinase 1
MKSIDLEHYEFEYDHALASGDRTAHRQLHYEPDHKAKKESSEIVAELAEEDDTLETGFETSYHPAKYEREWMTQALGPFYVMGDITDVLRLVKGGKEASVYMCAADPGLGEDYLAAKVFRPRRFRALRNDAVYRHGRAALEADGSEMRDRRGLHAMHKGTDTGKEMRQTSWLAHEFVALGKLHSLGLDVPKPIASGHNSILMTYIGDASMPAPTLNTVDLQLREARELFDRLVWNVDVMLANEMIHGDLSAYNVLYWHGTATIIDFPQVVSPYENPSAESIFRRDVHRLCEYFVTQGVSRDSKRIADDLWNKHVPADLWPTDPLQFQAWEYEDENGRH